MIKPLNLIDQYQLYAKRYDYKKNARILTLDDEQVVVKERRKNQKELFSYLDSKDFHYALKPVNLEALDEFDIYPFVLETVKRKDEKAVDMMYILSLLHNKTSYYKEMILDDIKAIYEDLDNRIDYLYYYYQSLQDSLEKKVYMAPDEYLLMRNITSVYRLLHYAKGTNEKWYSQVKMKKSIRYVMLHSNLEVDHFLQGDHPYLISWDHARRDFPIYDFLNFFQNEYADLDMNSLFQIYKHKYPFTKEEETLFFTLISLPPKLVLERNTYNKYSDVHSFVTYLNKSIDFLSKQDEGYQEAYE